MEDLQEPDPGLLVQALIAQGISGEVLDDLKIIKHFSSEGLFFFFFKKAFRCILIKHGERLYIKCPFERFATITTIIKVWFM